MLYRLTRISRSPRLVLGYDNFNFLDTIRDQVLGLKSRVMRNLTTAILVESPSLPTTGLTQDMLNTAIPLNPYQIESSPGMVRDSISAQCTMFLLSKAIQSIHSSAVDAVFQDHEDMRPMFPQVKSIPPRPTNTVHHLGGIFFDEGTIEGTYGVHRNIWLDQLGFSEAPADSDFFSRLWLVWGDQKTAEIIRSIKKEQRLASQEFDRRDWMLGPPAYFHVLQSLMYMIVRTHWSSPEGANFKCNLLHDIKAWHRAGIDRDNVKYHIVEPLLQSSWNARILGLFYAELGAAGYLQGLDASYIPQHIHEHRQETYDEAIRRLTPSQYMDTLRTVYRKVFTFSAWTGAGDFRGEFTTMCRFLQEVELFLLLRHAVKHGSIGIIRRLVDPLIVFFFGSGQSRYGHEMLHLRWLLSDGVTSPSLQHAILASGLVNILGKPDTFQAIDLVLEHVNCMYKLDMRNHKNSTHDVNSTFNRVALTSGHTLQLRATVESAFGERSKNDHTRRSSNKEIFALALSLWDSGCCSPPAYMHAREGILSNAPKSHDVITTGVNMLHAKVADFNQNHVTSGLFVPSLDVVDPGSINAVEARFINVAEYAEAVDDTFYAPSNAGSDYSDTEDVL